MPRMTSKKVPVTTQMNLLFCSSEPVALPQDRQQELAIALADLLISAAVVAPTESDPGDGR
jgi:hypothetical protein